MKTFTRRAFIKQTCRLGLSGTGAYAMSSILVRGWLPGGLTDNIPSISKIQEVTDVVTKGTKAGIRAFSDFTPQQEYYIGRTVGAVVLENYKPYDNAQVNGYLNRLGQTLAQASDLPETFNGYHFLALDSSDINALATPSGLVFVTRGILRCCANEGELAAILAHEVGHVQLKHGLKAIKTSRYTEFGTIIGTAAAKSLTGSQVSDLVRSFEGTIDDITTEMINKGYSRASEEEADESAAVIMKRVGYSPVSLVKMLETMDSRLKPEGLDFAKTHPSPRQRIEYLDKVVAGQAEPAFSESQKSRFQEAMNNI